MNSIGDWLTEYADLPHRDRDLLLMELAGFSRSRIIAFPDTRLDADQRRQLQQAAARLRDGEPLAYVVGHQPFWSLDFTVTEDVLIPRPETELLVELALALTPEDGAVLDMGTGSGAIAVSLAHARGSLRVSATDRSPQALQVAEQNAHRYGLHISFMAVDWFEQLHGRWHTIVSNPPYIAAGDPHLPDLRFEPADALIGGVDGLRDLRTIINGAPQHLHHGGHLIVEHGYDQAPPVRALFEHAGFVDVRSVRDLAQIERATLGCWQGSGN